MYEDILEECDFDNKDLLEQFIKGVLENYDKLDKRLRNIENDLEDIKEMVKLDII